MALAYPIQEIRRAISGISRSRARARMTTIRASRFESVTAGQSRHERALESEMNALNEKAAETAVTRAVAQRWIQNSWRCKEPKILTRLRTECARDLGRRTRWIPLAAPGVMLVLLAAGGWMKSQWPAIVALFALMVAAAITRIHLSGKLRAAAPREAAWLARSYGYAADIQAFTWGGICGVMLFSHGTTPLTLVVLAATAGVTAAAYTTLTLEQGMWLRFSTALWLPLLILLMMAALDGLHYGWLILSLTTAYGLLSTLHGVRLVNQYIDGEMTRSQLSEAIAKLEAQRNELDAHQARVSALSDTAHRLSYYDQLTQLGSRQHFNERLERAVRRHLEFSCPFVLLYLDVNGFTDINDSMGHAAGDQMLQTIGQRIHASLRADDFAARLGSDEFAVLLLDVNEGEAATLTHKLCETIQSPATVDDQPIHPSVSIGMSTCPQDGTTPNDLLKAAESAMHAAKHSPKSSYMRYRSSMSAAAVQRLTVVQELRQALNDQQFQLLYQPQIDTKTASIVGVEALIRWHHPKQGLIPPLEFIGVAERHGLIDELGEWVLRTACQQAVAWREDGLRPFRMGVNISPLQLIEPDFVHKVAAILGETRMPAGLLELEITESAVQTRPEARQTLAHLKELGVCISIDDFGTGYSSLVSLKSLPVDRVKIDRAFVTDMLASARDTALLGTIIDMAHVLGTTVVAEGVEKAAHVESLRRLGCDCLQGHYFSPAVAPAHVMKMAPRTVTTPEAAS